MRFVGILVLCLANLSWADQQFGSTVDDRQFDLGLLYVRGTRTSTAVTSDSFQTTTGENVVFNCEKNKRNVVVNRDVYDFPVKRTGGGYRGSQTEVQTFFVELEKHFNTPPGTDLPVERLTAWADRLLEDQSTGQHFISAAQDLVGLAGSFSRCLVLQNLVKSRGRTYSSPIWITLTSGAPGTVHAVHGPRRASAGTQGTH